jgi:hypothetical protein
VDDLKRLKAVYRQFDKEREISDPEHVDFDAVRGQSVLAPLRRRFLLAGEGEHVAQLFAGGRGSGKTTELKRFKKDLEEAGLTSVYVDVLNTIDVNSCGFGDYLVAIAFGVRQAVVAGEVPGASKVKIDIEAKFEEVRGLFGTRLRVPGIELGANPLGLEAKAKVDFERPPSSRAALEGELESIASDATKGVQDMLKRLDETVVKEGKSGLVVLVDGADKITPYPVDGSDVEQHVKIFANRATYLCRLGCHMVYSVPLSFCYSPHAQTFSRTASVEAPIVLPNTSLESKGRDKEGQTVTGRDLFREMVERRLKTINESVGAVIEKRALDLAITESGCNPDAFVVILQGAFVRMEGDLPLKREAVDSSVQEIANGMSRQVQTEWWELLQDLKSRQNYSDKSSHPFRMCLYFHYVYEYANGEPQFEVNPVLRRLRQMAD